MPLPGSHYTRNAKARYFNHSGNYVADSSVTTMKVGSFDPNDYGLYDGRMWRNGAAPTLTGYDLINDLNPEIDYRATPDDPRVMTRKVVRGGAWKDTEYFIRTSTRSYEYQDTAKSYVGFRCVRSSFRNELHNR